MNTDLILQNTRKVLFHDSVYGIFVIIRLHINKDICIQIQCGYRFNTYNIMLSLAR